MSIFDLFKKIEIEKPNTGPVSWVVCGLGNPGPKYDFTRHNAGFLSLDLLAASKGVKPDRLRFKALTAEATVALPDGSAARILFLKPQTFMNLSGESLREALSFYKLPPDRAVVLYDDVSLPVGRLRVREKGSDGGHNGIKSIIYQCKTDVFPRVKIGVGSPPHPGYDMADWVLGRFSADEQSVLARAAAKAGEAALTVVASGCGKAANDFNGYDGV